MTSAANLTIVVDAINNANRTLQQVRSDLKGVEAQSAASGNALKAIGASVGFQQAQQGIGSLVKSISEMAQASLDDAASTKRLEQAIANTGGSYSAYEKQINAVIAAGQAKAETDDQIRGSLSLLVAQTGDAGEALKRFGLAEDLARGAGIDLETASRLLGKVTDDNVKVLARYGVSIRQGATQTELFGAIQQKFGGQAREFAESNAGAAAKARIAYQELQEELGSKLQPAYTDVIKAALGLPAPLDLAATAALKLGPAAISTGSGLATMGVAAQNAGITLAGIRAGAGAAALGLGAVSVAVGAVYLGWLAFDKITGPNTVKVSNLAEAEAKLATAHGIEKDGLTQLVAALKKRDDETKAASELTDGFSVALSALQQHLSGLNGSLVVHSAEWNKAVDAEKASILATDAHKDVITAANLALGKQVDSQGNVIASLNELVARTGDSYNATIRDKNAKLQWAAAHNIAADSMGNILPTMSELIGREGDSYQATQRDKQAKLEFASANHLAADSMGNLLPTFGELVGKENDSYQATQRDKEAKLAYASANHLLADSVGNLLPTMSELVGKTQDSYIATQRDTEARREAYAAMGLETDSMGNLIQTTEQLVRAQEDSINASIRQSNATLQVAQNDFPHLVQQARASALANQAMEKATAEANKELVAEGLIADKTASSLNGLASAQYSVADYGTAALAPNFRPQDFQTIRGSPTVNGQSATSAGGSSGGSSGGAASSGGSVGGTTNNYFAPVTHNYGTSAPGGSTSAFLRI